MGTATASAPQSSPIQAPTLKLADLDGLASGPPPSTGKILTLSDLDSLANAAGPGPNGHPLDSANGLVSNWWDQVHHGPANLYDVGKSIAGLATGQTEKNLGAQSGALWQKTKDAYNQGDYGGAAFHLLNYALSGVPGVSSVIDSAGEDFRNGHPMAGAGKTLGLITNLGMGIKTPEIVDAAARVPGAVANLPEQAVQALRDRIKNVNNPVIENSLSSLAPNVRMTPYQRAGQTGTESSARNLRNMPGTASEAEEFYQGQQDDIAAEARSRIGAQQSQGALPSYSGQPMQITNDVGAGNFIKEELDAATRKRKADADSAYDYVRQKTAANVQPVQTGTTVSSPIVNASGQPYGGAPIYGLMETPIDLAPIRAKLQPVYDDLANNLTPVQQMASPAFTQLKSLMTRSDLTHMPAMEFDKFLGALKSITRNGESQILSSPSQALAKNVIGVGENSMDQALAGAGPDVKTALQRGRDAVRDYHASDEFRQDLGDEPASIYDAMTKGGNRAINTLQTLKGYSPAAVDTIGRTYLNEMLDKATREGGWGRSNGVDADWNRLGDDTKELLYGPETTRSLNQLFLGAKRLTPAEGSATAGRLSAFASYGDIGTALAELVGGAMAGHLEAGALGAGGTLLATRVRPAILARVAFRPGGAAALNQAIHLPVNSPAWVRAMTALTGMASGKPVAQQQSDSDLSTTKPLNPYSANPYK